jgi:hypothetical protein
MSPLRRQDGRGFAGLPRQKLAMTYLCQRSRNQVDQNRLGLISRRLAGAHRADPLSTNVRGLLLLTLGAALSHLESFVVAFRLRHVGHCE